MAKLQFKKFALLLLLYTILVILWGAWVRISHSGDGCGDTWPLCHGQLIPEAERGKTWIEYGHRLMSGIFGLVVVYFWWTARKLYSGKSFTRRTAAATLIFTISEALLGAKLVLFHLVTSNDTPYRAFVIALHQINSFMLTGAVVLAFASATNESEPAPSNSTLKKFSLFPWLIVIIGITGAWASLSNSLFPSHDLVEGFLADFSSQSHFLIRLRGLHPLLAIVGGGGLALYFWTQTQVLPSGNEKKLYFKIFTILSAALIFGICTLIFHAPVWMKITHLAFAHIVWTSLLSIIYALKSKRDLTH